MEALPLRIPPGTDLRRSLETAVGTRAAFVVSGIGSLRNAVTGFAELVVQRKSGAPSGEPVLVLHGTQSTLRAPK
jgi:predicted DNA-binding protein with PD1-like motif